MEFKDLEFTPHSLDLQGLHAIVKFDNGFGASIIQTNFSQGGRAGLFELAVLKEGHVNSTTPITDDVIGHLTPEDVMLVLDQIKKL